MHQKPTWCLSIKRQWTRQKNKTIFVCYHLLPTFSSIFSGFFPLILQKSKSTEISFFFFLLLLMWLCDITPCWSIQSRMTHSQTWLQTLSKRQLWFFFYHYRIIFLFLILSQQVFLTRRNFLNFFITFFSSLVIHQDYCEACRDVFQLNFYIIYHFYTWASFTGTQLVSNKFN